METVEGMWLMECRNSTSVCKINQRDRRISCWYNLENEEFNTPWYGNAPHKVTFEQLHSIKWPSFLQPGDKIIAHVTKSGYCYIEDDT